MTFICRPCHASGCRQNPSSETRLHNSKNWMILKDTEKPGFPATLEVRMRLKTDDKLVNWYFYDYFGSYAFRKLDLIRQI